MRQFHFLSGEGFSAEESTVEVGVLPANAMVEACEGTGFVSAEVDIATELVTTTGSWTAAAAGGRCMEAMPGNAVPAFKIMEGLNSEALTEAREDPGSCLMVTTGIWALVGLAPIRFERLTRGESPWTTVKGGNGPDPGSCLTKPTVFKSPLYILLVEVTQLEVTMESRRVEETPDETFLKVEERILGNKIGERGGDDRVGETEDR